MEERNKEERKRNEELMDAVTYHNVKAVLNCLEGGVDPNYSSYKYDEAPYREIQPTTPLQMVMFRISDCLLEDSDLKEFAEIAILLLHYGADPKPAMHIAEDRYGEYNPNDKSLFMDVWHIIANA